MSLLSLNSFKQESQSMLDSMSKESTEVLGHPVKYIPRDIVDTDNIFNDVKRSSFTSYYDTKMVVEIDESQLGEQDFLSKFGIEIKNSISFSINKTKWSEDIPFDRPKEGDLIYFEMSDRLWEITYVDNFKENKLTSYDYLSFHISCEVFEFNQETFDIDTGIDTLDKFDDDMSYSIDLTLGSGDGVFAKDEVVYQGVNLQEATARAIVIGWNPDTKVLRINDVVGNFMASQMIVGNSSGSAYLLGATTTLSTPTDLVTHFANDDYADNQEIEIESDKIIDWSEIDPFSEGEM